MQILNIKGRREERKGGRERGRKEIRDKMQVQQSGETRPKVLATTLLNALGPLTHTP